jgi:Holliday junction resolvase RusA-like endonuclease
MPLLAAEEIVLPPCYNTPPPAEIKARSKALRTADEREAVGVLVERRGTRWHLIDGLRTVLACRSIPAAHRPRLNCTVTTTVQQLRIRDWWPTLLNVALRLHYHARSRRYGDDVARVLVAQSIADLRPAAGRREVHLLVEVGTRSGKVPDPDALYKSLLDGLVHVGLLRSDDWQGVRLTGVDFRRAQKNGLVVRLTDVPADPWFHLGGAGECGHKKRRRKRT